LGTYDRQSRQIDISGDLIPLKQLSKLIGYVPFFGELLTGIDKTGIFSTQFTLKGDADDPDVGVNLFALAPGLLRDILSPDWLGGERRRILGVDEQAEK
ncbi:MAG: AsmA-like C-terminal domain-containing protein, partial [Candidatus Puniceispirillaceae bacterium]